MYRMGTRKPKNQKDEVWLGRIVTNSYKKMFIKKVGMIIYTYTLQPTPWLPAYKVFLIKLKKNPAKLNNS